MTFTGINYQNLASSKSFTLDLDNIILYYSGDKYNAGLPSGIHFGFSGASSDVSFKGLSGKLYDPEGRVVYGYSENNSFSLSFSCDANNYDYYINDTLYCSKGTKSDIDLNKFFFNCNGLAADVNFNIYGPVIDYSLSFPDVFSGQYLTGVFENNSSSNIKIFTGSLTAGNTGDFSTDAINNLTINANSSGAIVLNSLSEDGGIFYSFNLQLNTNFGIINQLFQTYK